VQSAWCRATACSISPANVGCRPSRRVDSIRRCRGSPPPPTSTRRWSANRCVWSRATRTTDRSQRSRSLANLFFLFKKLHTLVFFDMCGITLLITTNKHQEETNDVLRRSLKKIRHRKFKLNRHHNTKQITFTNSILFHYFQF
jgi:hypothetical protein